MMLGCGCRVNKEAVLKQYEAIKAKVKDGCIQIKCPGMNNGCSYILKDQELIAALGPQKYKELIISSRVKCDVSKHRHKESSAVYCVARRRA